MALVVLKLQNPKTPKELKEIVEKEKKTYSSMNQKEKDSYLKLKGF